MGLLRSDALRLGAAPRQKHRRSRYSGFRRAAVNQVGCRNRVIRPPEPFTRMRWAADRITQCDRRLAELNIDIICANIPQAKRRVERAFGTLQDRLVKELRRADIAAANAWLPTLFADYNRCFAVCRRTLRTCTNVTIPFHERSSRHRRDRDQNPDADT